MARLNVVRNPQVHYTARGRAVLGQSQSRLLTDAACQSKSVLWGRAEKAILDEDLPWPDRCLEAEEALRLCDSCPLSGGNGVCATWAELERYDGLAAGAYYRNGRRINAAYGSDPPRGALSDKPRRRRDVA